MEQFGWQVVVCQMKDEWRSVGLGNGKRCVTTTGVRMKQELCAGNLDIPPKVCCIAVIYFTCILTRAESMININNI